MAHQINISLVEKFGEVFCFGTAISTAITIETETRIANAAKAAKRTAKLQATFSIGETVTALDDMCDERTGVIVALNHGWATIEDAEGTFDVTIEELERA